ncbi:RING finger protein 215 [Ambystoma mexicanum]|uniref:RING finger protein 215 n=1 Tax=Ambystoma mexicanum TaxID=8296 RepID=UPI0037E99802
MTVVGSITPLLPSSLFLGQLISLCLCMDGQTAVRVEVFMQQPGTSEQRLAPEGGSYMLPGVLLGTMGDSNVNAVQVPGAGLQREEKSMVEVAQGNLLLVGDTELPVADEENWIGVVPVGEEQSEIHKTNKEESFAATVVNRMKRALVLGASALLLLALNQSTVRELDVSQVLLKPVIVIQASENVTKLLNALLRGLRATTKITYKAALLENLGVTLTLWSTCGRSRGGLYGEWQGVICTGETSSQVQKYLQQLWNTILLVSLVVCTGVIIQVQRRSRLQLSNTDPELDLRQHILRRLSALKTQRYHPPKYQRTHTPDVENCAVCLDQFNKNQCLRVLPCLHQFHRDCVDPWLLLHYTCPLCKYNILGNVCREI